MSSNPRTMDVADKYTMLPPIARSTAQALSTHSEQEEVRHSDTDVIDLSPEQVHKKASSKKKT